MKTRRRLRKTVWVIGRRRWYLRAVLDGTVKASTACESQEDMFEPNTFHRLARHDEE